jgi:hypothetical protein
MSQQILLARTFEGSVQLKQLNLVMPSQFEQVSWQQMLLGPTVLKKVEGTGQLAH